MRLLFVEKDKQPPCLLWFEKQIASARCLFRRRGTAIYVATVLLAKKAQKKRAPKRPPKSCDLILQISVFLRESGKQVAEVT